MTESEIKALTEKLERSMRMLCNATRATNYSDKQTHLVNGMNKIHEALSIIANSRQREIEAGQHREDEVMT